MRQVYLAELLAGHGAKVYTYGLCTENPWNGHHSSLVSCSTLQDALRQGEHLVLPTPMLKDGFLWGKGDFDDMDISALLAKRMPHSFLFAGCIPDSLHTLAESFSISCVDFMKDENTAYRNTIAATEGIMAEAITRSPKNLTDSSCLVLGYGKCGSTLVSYLKQFTHSLSVYDGNEEAGARAGVHANVLTYTGLVTQLAQADFIFNTIPDMILNADLLSKVKQDALILDLASPPGGIDYNFAAKLGIQAVLLPGLPGKYAPFSSAEILYKCILQNLECLGTLQAVR